jgi:hypothetical protein
MAGSQRTENAASAHVMVVVLVLVVVVRLVAGDGLEPSTCGLWARRAASAPPRTASTNGHGIPAHTGSQ